MSSSHTSLRHSNHFPFYPLYGFCRFIFQMAQLQRHCLVTVGATVGFKQLTEQVLQPEFWEFLSAEGFTSLRIQCGPDISWASARLDSLRDRVPEGLEVHVFETTPNLMMDEMMLCKACSGLRRMGVVVSHAGEFGARYMAGSWWIIWHGLMGDESRNWDDSRCLESWPSSHRRPERDAAGQPPSRNGQAPRKGGLRHHKHSKVISLT